MSDTYYIKESQDIIKMAQFPKMQQMWASCRLEDALKTIAKIRGSAWASNMHIIAVIILSLSKREAFDMGLILLEEQNQIYLHQSVTFVVE